MSKPTPLEGEDELLQKIERIVLGLDMPMHFMSDELLKKPERIMALIRTHTATKEREARIDENKYYAKLLKLNEKSKDDKTSIKVSLRKIFEYRLKQLATLNAKEKDV